MTIEQQEVSKAIEELLRLATRNKVLVCGFAFAAEPAMLTNFGNCSDCHTLKVYEKLVQMCEEKRAAGKIQQITVGEVN